MIRRLNGTIAETGLNFVILDVNDVGYQIYTISPEKNLLDSSATFHTHLAVRENSLDLYGFADRDTLEFFELLIGLPKIGPKSALQILNQAEISLIREAVTNNDPAHLSKLSGIGKKSAEKIVLGLKDKLDTLNYNSTTSSLESTTSGPNHTADTIDALISLGYAPQEARRIVIEITEADPTLSTSSETIRIALKRLSRQ